MASAASRVFRSAAPAAAIFGSAVYLSPIYAEDASKTVRQQQPGRSASGEKLPIYPASEREAPVTLIEAPSSLVPYIAQARETTTEAFSGVGSYVEAGVRQWIGFERRVEKEVKSVLPKDESLNPGLIYVLIAGLTGSVLARPRALPIRFLAPPLFAVAAAPYFLPKTSHNVRAYLSDVEDRVAPEFAASHDRVNAAVSTHWEMLKDRLGRAGEEAQHLGQRAVRGVEDATGLKVADAIKASMEEAQREKERIERVREGGLETVGYVVEQRPVAEIVRSKSDAAAKEVDRI